MSWSPRTCLSPDEVHALADGDRVLVRLSRLWEPEPRTIYDGEATLVRERNGLCFTGAGVPSWADYSTGPGFTDLNRDGTLTAEDYLAEISARLD